MFAQYGPTSQIPSSRYVAGHSGDLDTTSGEGYCESVIYLRRLTDETRRSGKAGLNQKEAIVYVALVVPISQLSSARRVLFRARAVLHM